MAGGDRRAFKVLCSRYYEGVWRFVALKMGSSMAADLTQEVFLRVVAARARWEPGSFRAWLYTIARNVCRDARDRQRFRNHESLDVHLSGSGEGPETRVDKLPAAAVPVDEGLDQRRAVSVALDVLRVLPDEQSEVFVLRAYAGLTFAEIGEATGTNANTCKTRYRLAARDLREALLTAGFGPQGRK